MSDSIKFERLGPGLWLAERGSLAARIAVTDDGKFHAQIHQHARALCNYTWTTFGSAKEWCLQHFQEESK
jgi:cation transport regulator ChaC